MPDAPWSNPSGVAAVVDEWLNEGTVRRCFAAERTLPAQGPKTAPIPAQLSPGLAPALTERGIEEL